MNNKNEKKNKWQNSKVFYAVAMSLVIAIVGVASVIYNLSKIKNVLPDNGESGFYSVTTGERTTAEHIANKPQTGVPDNRDITDGTTKRQLPMTSIDRTQANIFCRLIRRLPKASATATSFSQKR